MAEDYSEHVKEDYTDDVEGCVRVKERKGLPC